MIGSELAAHSAPDGHTLLVQINNLTALPALSPGKKATVTVESFAPITLAAVLPHVLVVPRSVQASSVRELKGGTKDTNLRLFGIRHTGASGWRAVRLDGGD